jgi:hypothetical protein
MGDSRRLRSSGVKAARAFWKADSNLVVSPVGPASAAKVIAKIKKRLGRILFMVFLPSHS